MNDPVEAARRNGRRRYKTTKHPYAAIEHRVIDSAAYADLTFSARALLVQIARQLSADNNGHLHAAHSYMERFGFGSEHTLRRSIAELISHGFIYRTKSHCGYRKLAAQYAVTWLSITCREGLYLDAFVPCAWRNWAANSDMTDSFSGVSKLPAATGKNGRYTPRISAKNAGMTPIKGAENELIAIPQAFRGCGVHAGDGAESSAAEVAL